MTITIFGNIYIILDRFQYFLCSNFDPQFYKKKKKSFSAFNQLSTRTQIKAITDFDMSWEGNMLFDKLDIFFSTRIYQHVPRKRVMFFGSNPPPKKNY